MARTLYRIVKRNPPTREDFLSYEALGKVPRRPLPPELAQAWSGVSTYDDKHVARAYARQRTHLGQFIATLEIEDGAPIRVEQTGSDTAHCDLWGDPDEMLARVVALDRV